MKEGGRVLALPAIQAVLRSQIALAAKGNVQAQRAVFEAIQAIEQENVLAAELASVRNAHAQDDALAASQTVGRKSVEAAALAAENAGKNMSHTEAARRVMSLLRLDEQELKLKSGQDTAGAAPSAVAPRG